MFTKRKAMDKMFNYYSRLVYKLSVNGYAPLPPLIVWSVTLKCNMRCRMCTFYGEHAKQNLDLKNELGYVEFKKAIDNISEAYKCYPYKPLIGLFGGEPFLRKDIFGIMGYLKSKGFKFSVTTNFSILDENRLKKLINLKPNDLRISLDGPPEIHDKIRGIKGVFNKIYSGIMKFRSLEKGEKIPVRLNCVINDYNIKYLGEMVEIAHNLKADLNFQHLMFVNEKYKKLNTAVTKKLFGKDLLFGHDLPRIKKEDTALLITNIKKAIAKAKKLRVNVTILPDLRLNEIKPYYLDLDTYRHSKYCAAPWTTGRIDNKGRVNPCIDYFYGNIRNEGFKNIWNNKKARYFRKTLKRSKLFPGCIRCCKI